MREEEKGLSETAKNITIYYGYEFRTYTGNIYDKNEFFYAQYCQTARCISEIVNESEIFCEKYRNGRSEYDQESSRAERQELRGYPNNIVAFCSRRGNGKTSAMLSMTRALEMLPLKDETEEKYEFWRKARDTPRKFYDNNHENFERKAKKQVEDCSYLVMETIDPANMEQNDSILLNILSRMYHMWNQDFKQEKSRDEYISRDLVNAFQDAYRNVYSLKKPLEGDELDEYDSLTRLSEKGDSVNTKHAFRKLVEYFLQYFKKNMLVIPVDDADLNTTRAYEIVEDLRKYCVGPRILVILALHLDTLRNCIEQENVKRYRYLLSNQMNIPHLPGNKCREMAERYIDKLIPGYHQIHLPYVDEWFRTGRSDINLFYYSSIILYRLIIHSKPPYY